MPDLPAFGRWLRARREALDSSPAALGERVGCTGDAIQSFENEQLRPSGDLAARLAIQLGLNADAGARFVQSARITTPPARLARYSTTLPKPLTPLVGRATEVATVCGLLERADIRLVTLVGPPGIGKTRLAVQVAADLQAQFADGALVVALASVNDAAGVVAAISEALADDETGGRLPLEQLLALVRDKQMLLVLDNFEQVVAAAPLLSELLHAAPGLTILATSRTPLHIYGEHRFVVPPLTLPALQPLPALEAIMEYEAVRLFVARAQAVQHDFMVTAANIGTIVEICTCLEGVPLALELAAARIHLFPPHTLLQRLDSQLQVLTGGPRDLPARHQTLRAAIDWSYRLLAPDEQTLFCRLGVFSQGCTIEAAEAVCTIDDTMPSAVLDGLTALLNLHLLRQEYVTDGEPRYSMPAAIRDYALERLDERNESAILEQRLCRYWLSCVACKHDWLASRRQRANPVGLAVCLVELAGVLGRQPVGAIHAAQLLGAVDQLLATNACCLSPDDCAIYERVLDAVRNTLGDKYPAARNAGSSMPLEQVIANVHQGMVRSGSAPAELCEAPPEAADRRERHPEGLTGREVAVLRLLARGLTYEQIAEQLVISPRTVNRHLTSIYGKLDVSSRHAATLWALENQFT